MNTEPSGLQPCHICNSLQHRGDECPENLDYVRRLKDQLSEAKRAYQEKERLYGELRGSASVPYDATHQEAVDVLVSLPFLQREIKAVDKALFGETLPYNPDRALAIRTMQELTLKLKEKLAYLHLQRDALLEITWLDLPGEPHESTERWKEEFNKRWVGRSDLEAEQAKLKKANQTIDELNQAAIDDNIL